MNPQRIAELRNIVGHVPERLRSAVAKILEEPIEEIERLRAENAELRHAFEVAQDRAWVDPVPRDAGRVRSEDFSLGSPI